MKHTDHSPPHNCVFDIHGYYHPIKILHDSCSYPHPSPPDLAFFPKHLSKVTPTTTTTSPPPCPKCRPDSPPSAHSSQLSTPLSKPSPPPPRDSTSFTPSTPPPRTPAPSTSSTPPLTPPPAPTSPSQPRPLKHLIPLLKTQSVSSSFLAPTTQTKPPAPQASPNGSPL